MRVLCAWISGLSLGLLAWPGDVFPRETIPVEELVPAEALAISPPSVGDVVLAREIEERVTPRVLPVALAQSGIHPDDTEQVEQLILEVRLHVLLRVLSEQGVEADTPQGKALRASLRVDLIEGADPVAVWDKHFYTPPIPTVMAWQDYADWLIAKESEGYTGATLAALGCSLPASTFEGLSKDVDRALRVVSR
jgi:hypothetical protein